MPVEIFFCYAHKDEELLNKLKTHLIPLYREGLIDLLWHDRNISAGTEWKQEIDAHLNTADVILLLISPDFMASDYINNVELKRAIERHDRGEARVIPIILRPVYWQGEPLGRLQALPKDGKPVTDRYWHNQDEAFFNIEVGIRNVVEELTPKPAIPSLIASIQPSKQEPSSPSVNALKRELVKPIPLVKPDEFSLLRILSGHSSRVLSVVFSPDGQTLASGCPDKTIKLWNPQTGELLRTLKHLWGVRCVAFSPDGQTLASGGDSIGIHSEIKLWNPQTGEELRTLLEPFVSAVAFSPAGQTLASSSNTKIKLWNPQTGVELRTTLPGYLPHVLSVAFSPDGQTLASGGADKTIKLWGKKSI